MISSHFYHSWQKNPFNFSDVLHKANYSLSVSKYDHFDAVDFSERHSEEVISFF